MSCPRIFISSTYYDLKHVREIIRDFVKDLGYEPVLSEFSDVFYQPGDTVQNSCLREISSCDIFVLIVGKRYGSYFPGGSLSITHEEYLAAHYSSIPIYSFVDLDVLHDYEFYNKNIDADTCNYRVVEDTNTFKLIHDIQEASTDNSLIAFTSIADILSHLKKQWARLFKSFLQNNQLSLSMQKTNVEIHENLDEFKSKLTIVGIIDLTQENVNAADSFIELVTSLGGSISDLGTDYKISINGKSTNIGKAVVGIFDSELKSIKTD